MPDISYPILLAVAAITWLLTFAAVLLAGVWFPWRRWSLRWWIKDFDAGLKKRARRRASMGEGRA
ncbi:hypothetical protein CAL29_28180 [Bordetella genomosp. 10]|uniref:Uncharacterized protein n=1 Tax=Bordetella genomosp. 10 TaxID=1416804 RepID=A0A261S3L9_9BORD|nr:hypothetical protein [Bordetella genomosp. 10]OZI31751.1 hypothetical protein CAL29_28180 [Bordetella genomosp. 10]